MSKAKQKKTAKDRAHFVRDAVVSALGEADLPATYYVRQRHIMDAYGFTRHYFRKMVRNGVLVEKHFVFENTGQG